LIDTIENNEDVKGEEDLDGNDDQMNLFMID
jgi:hypothetical protein